MGKPAKTSFFSQPQDVVDKYLINRPFLQESNYKRPPKRFVLWIDMMGAANLMNLSSRMAMIVLAKIHTASVKASDGIGGITVVPVVDGFYCVTKNAHPLRTFAYRFLKSIVSDIILIRDPHYIYLLRGAISFGPVVTGNDLKEKIIGKQDDPGSQPLLKLENQAYLSHILVGSPLATAYHGERQAPPFGIYVDDSVRMFGFDDEGFTYRLWKWWGKNDTELIKLLKRRLELYMQWCTNNSTSLAYPKEAILRHTELITEYFSDFTHDE